MSSPPSSSASDVYGPPPINYSLRARKRAIIISWSIIAVDSCLLPIVMFYALWFTPLSHSNTFNILSSIFGFPTILQWAKRMWYLCRKDSDCRPLGGARLRVNFFQISFTLNALLVLAQLLVAVWPAQPIVPLFAMLQETVLFTTGAQLIAHFVLHNLGATQRVRISSTPKGARVRPAVYTIAEDIVAVDGGGGRRFREEWNARYEASPAFRRMLSRLDAFWGFGAVAVAGAATALVWTVPVAAGYWIGWFVPFAWAALWARLTVGYVQRCLAEEYAGWKLGAMREVGLSVSSAAVPPPAPAYLTLIPRAE
ncbi:hypothetical protein HWV62_35690 [Athelia sp. TMB]|nr:hypothetical protein HWV62_35690 [Athelia sp. TMB]